MNYIMKFLCNETKSNSSEKNSDISFIMLPKTSKFIQSEISFFCIVFKQNNIYEFILIKNNLMSCNYPAQFANDVIKKIRLLQNGQKNYGVCEYISEHDLIESIYCVIQSEINEWNHSVTNDIYFEILCNKNIKFVIDEILKKNVCKININNNHYYGDDYCVIDLFIIKNHSTDIEKKYFITIPSLKQIKRLKKSQHTIKTTFPYIFLYKSFFNDKALNLK